jgi:rhodanese-related sulfurtransferase
MLARTLLFLALSLAATTASAADAFRLATQEQVEAWISSREAMVWDVNPPEVFEKNHLPGARFLTGKDWTKGLPAAKDARLVFYCAGPR